MNSEQELIRTLDYILNRCSERDIEAIAAAVVRRRRDIAIFGKTFMAPNARSLAEDINSQLNIQGSIESLKTSVREYAIRIIRQQAPELTDKQVEELTRAWIPSEQKGPSRKSSSREQMPIDGSLPRDVLSSMIDQFVSFSLGRMEEEEDLALRKEMGPWPDKYWKSFPQVIRLLITDFLKDRIEEKDFNARIGLALNMH